MIADGKSYDWICEVLLQQNAHLLVELMEPTGVPVIRLAINSDGSFQILQAGAQPAIPRFQQRLAEGLARIYLAANSPAGDVALHYSGEVSGPAGLSPQQIQYTSKEQACSLRVEILSLKSIGAP